MATGFNFEADAGYAAPTLHPERPETRENNHNMPPSGWTRRRWLRAALTGSGALAAAGITTGVLLWPHPEEPDPGGATATKSPEQLKPRGDFEQFPRVFYGPDGQPRELRRDQIKPPETLDPPTLQMAFAHVGQAIEYYVNVNDLAGIQTVVPGTTDLDALQPGQLYERAAFIERFRKVFDTSHDEMLHRDDPENLSRHYAWGFQVELLEQVDQLGTDVEDLELVQGRVRVAYGDYRPEINGHHRVWQIEKPHTYEGDMWLTRYANLGLNARLPNNGWGVYKMSFPQLPPRIKQSPPPGYEKTPPLYLGRG